MLDYHLKGYQSEERADIMGNLLFNGGLFPPKSSNPVAVKVTRTVTSTIFSAVALLRSIDSNAGALNDASCQQYAELEDMHPSVTKLWGQGMLHKRWKLIHA